jgi:hypothetical protein
VVGRAITTSEQSFVGEIHRQVVVDGIKLDGSTLDRYRSTLIVERILDDQIAAVAGFEGANGETYQKKGEFALALKDFDDAIRLRPQRQPYGMRGVGPAR